jgi:mannose-1-phosphate guanylyltransferase / mannose-6-phosphate isomerase
MVKVTPVLLSGGTGTRLWPLSREAYPKQLLPLVDTETLLQGTARRVAAPDLFTDLLVIANAEHRFVIAEQLRAIDAKVSRLVLEPVGRNTAPAAAVAALIALQDDPDVLILLMPADHSIGDTKAFEGAVRAGVEAARKGSMVLFGVRPTSPATGYGYIRLGPPVSEGAGVRQVHGFSEKPDQATAQAYLQSGDYAWNSGIFLLPARVLIDEIAAFEPDLMKACEDAVAHARADLDFLRLDPKSFERARSISLDYAVMERTGKAVVVPVDFPWSDIGAWSALWDIGAKDDAGNVVVGDALAEGCSRCYVRGESQLVAALGVQDLIIVATPDAVLVTAKGRDQDVKKIVDRLKTTGRDVATQTQRVHRPWGFYQSILTGDRFHVKRITVKPGAKLSLQKHYHRAEHWVVVNGTALVTRNDEQHLVGENESIYLPFGCVHRLENPGCLPLNLIEVQSGPYLGEDDIVRFDDVYSRA